MVVYLSKMMMLGSEEREYIYELEPEDFKVTHQEADKIFVEDRSGNRQAFADFDCVIMRKIKEARKEAESKAQECFISIVFFEEVKVKFRRLVDIKVAKW